MKTTFEFDDYVKTSNPAPLSDIVSSHPTAGVESLGREDALDLNFVELTETEFGNLGNQFISNIEFNGQAILDAHIAEIPFDKMKGFLDEASGKRNGTERFITAVNISFGSDDVNIQPIYQSVYLKWIKRDVKTGKDVYYVSNTGLGIYQIFDGHNFSPITQTQRDRMVSSYKARMKNKHTSGGALGNFIPGTDSESVLIPLQIIYSIMHFGEDVAFITHAVKDDIDDLVYPKKHTLMVSSIRFGIVKSIYYADRSHLCPPCSASTAFFSFQL